jgi:hypothetical protein
MPEKIPRGNKFFNLSNSLLVGALVEPEVAQIGGGMNCHRYRESAQPQSF